MNLYQVLGVEKDADATVIKRAYRKLCAKYHPDKHPGDMIVEERFKEVTAAYHVLSDPTRRRDYDRAGTEEKAQAAEAARTHVDNNVSEFIDLFGQFLGDFFGQKVSGPAPVEVRAQRSGESEEPLLVDDEYITIRQGGAVIRIKKSK